MSLACHQTLTLPPWSLGVDPSLMISTHWADTWADEMSDTRRSRRSRLYVSWYHCAGDSLDHAVTDEAFAQGLDLQEGCYQAVCGHVVLIGSCLVPPGPPCVACVALLRILNRPAASTAGPGRHRKAHRWCRLFDRHQTPAVPQSRPRQRARATPERDGRTTTSMSAGQRCALRSPGTTSRLTTDQLIIAPRTGTAVESQQAARRLPQDGGAPHSPTTHCGKPLGADPLELQKSPARSPLALHLRRPCSHELTSGEQ